MRADQLRELFGLGPHEVLCGSFMCSHTRPGWGAQFLQVTGVIHVFSSLMVFHAAPLNKVVRLPFKVGQSVLRRRPALRDHSPCMHLTAPSVQAPQPVPLSMNHLLFPRCHRT